MTAAVATGGSAFRGGRGVTPSFAGVSGEHLWRRSAETIGVRIRLAPNAPGNLPGATGWHPVLPSL
jgi:hypothetical protein